MLSNAAVVAILAFASAVVAVPQPTMRPVVRANAVTGTEEIIDHAKWGKAYGGALDIAEHYHPTETATSAPEVTAAPSVAERQEAEAKLAARGPNEWTISIVNKLGRDIMTAHGLNAGFPAPVRGNVGRGVLRNGQSDFIAVPSGWAGNIPIVESGGVRDFRGDESLIEASFVTQGGSQAIFDINVSYVTGFSVPITCSCNVGVIAGCNTWLWDKSRCPNDNGAGSCRNPERDGWSSHPFFAPCQHAAYAYAHDDSANTGNGVCGGNTVTCCVGTDCPRNPRQQF
ncbi:hypothetical protein B0H66DRAFT_638306 [Apodospora peruviana]|uniref:Uncharacterized protein n=1 Tax=Apodospora peruviana TaxID=516989 RepID=A0AAE0M7F8_9PEZI|nr:hypothetical protein B0H66DRAFT_638306 [Apodospora peruviana]